MKTPEEKRAAHAAYMREYLRKHPEKRAHRTHPEEAAARRKRVRAKNIEHYRAYNRRWAKENIGAQRESKMRANIRRMGGHRIPAWSESALIVDFYERAIDISRVSGITHDVDHIIPLRGKTVSGLHVFDNLQILTMRENRIKHRNLLEIHS